MISEKTVNNFWKKVQVGGSDECWEWAASKNYLGYGLFRLNGRLITAHRTSYMINRGDIPVGYVVCHTCDNRGCVNPNHLWAGTQAENLYDMALKGRSANRKLMVDDVIVIRQLYMTGDYTQREIAKIFNVSSANISLIVSGKYWASVGELVALHERVSEMVS